MSEPLTFIEPTSQDFDCMHHALGRPSCAAAIVNAHRNHYTTCISALPERFLALGWWTESKNVMSADRTFHVNPAGLSALAGWLNNMQSDPTDAPINEGDREECQACSDYDAPCMYHRAFDEGWDAAIKCATSSAWEFR